MEEYRIFLTKHARFQTWKTSKAMTAAANGRGRRRRRGRAKAPLRTSDAVSAGSGGRPRRAGRGWYRWLTSPSWRRTRDVRRRDIATSLGGGGLSNAPPVHKRVPLCTFSRTASTLPTDWVSECACSEWNVLGRMRILLSELGLSGACFGLTLESRETSLDPDKPAPGQRPHDDTRSTTSVFIFAFVV